MPEKKRHHYVPQLYLKYFSKDKKTISVFSHKENRIVARNAPIKRQCYKNYLYSKHKKYEDVISSIEDKSKKIIDDILLSKTIPRKKNSDYSLLLLFILFQSARTLFATEQVNENLNKMGKLILKEAIRLKKHKGINPKDIDELQLNWDEPALLNLQSVSQILPLLYDLECKIIINETTNEFITSDNPVILYNKFYLKDELNYTGFASKGLIIMFPLTPNFSLIFFDSMIYKIGGKKLHKPVYCKNKSDVDEINMLQMINAHNTTYSFSMEEKYLIKLSSIASKYRFEEKTIVKESELFEPINGKKSKIIWTSRPKIKYNLNVSFIKIRKKITDSYLKQKLVRDPLLVKLHKEFLELVDKKYYKPNELGKFLKDKER
ncbi:MAG: DUF4238 domain-containing protein [Candidatus Cloacimonetes bacterium]|nr:DUF4238 domain-containing protein [Candidatus Cloacimonadota bacterium]